MHRLIACTVVWSAVALGIASAVPARPRYEPPAAPKPPALFDLSNTTWQGRLYMEGERVTFHPDGTLTYGFGAGNGGGSPGSWRLSGNMLYFEINKWSEYEVVVNGDLIQGKGWNKSGQPCQPVLKRVPYQGGRIP